MKQHEATQRTLQQLQRVEQERNQLKNKVRSVMPPRRQRAHYVGAVSASHCVVFVVCWKVCLRKIMHIRIVVAKHYFG